MRVEVTEEHIKNGVRHNLKKCPVALALREHFKDVIAGPVELCLDGRIHKTPEEAKRFIYRFDRNFNPGEFSFEV